MKDKAAKVIRIISVPPIMVTAMIAILFFTDKSIYSGTADMIMLILCLGVFPAFAYPVSKLWVCESKEAARNIQRKLAFAFSLFGYSVAMIWATLMETTEAVKAISLTYFLSVLLLTVMNQFMHIKASGHACSFTAPIIMLTVFGNWFYAIPGAVFSGLIFWSSLYLKRHTRSQLLWGMAVCMISFIIAYCCIYLPAGRHI